LSQILAVRSAFPVNHYSQAACTMAYAELAGLRPAQRALLDRLHRNAGVETRHTALPLEEYGALAGIAATNDRYIAEAAALGERALKSALDAAGLSPGDLDLLIVTSVTGVAVPSLDALLIPQMGLRPDVKRLPVFGLGCVAGAAGLARLHDYLLGWPGHVAALLSVELCSLAVPVTGLKTADLVASALFGDGAAAVIATGGAAGTPPRIRRRRPQRRGGPLPRILATRSEVYPDSVEALGWRLADDGFRIVLRAELAEVVEQRLGESVTAFLDEHGLTTDDINAWICHPGGPKVIDAARDSLKLPESAVAASRRSLAAVGNLSSASVLHILEQVVDCGEMKEGSFGLIVGLGPGVSAELVLVQWLSTGCCSA
jgi:alkylresorcinol/alkylpyrone synthase